MNINDYTYHICDRFVLLFIAFIGLVGTSYILVSGSLNSSSPAFNNFSTEFGITLHNKAINYGGQVSESNEINTQLIDGAAIPVPTDVIEVTSGSFSAGE